ncbi:MAG TPA: hypothetical protein VI299_18590 [Polyangiales bacterium]
MQRSSYAVCALVALVLACGDDDEAKPVVEPTVDAATPTPDASLVPDDAGTTTGRAIPLVEWVDDLVDHHTDDVSLPDSVDDKHIIDDEDPSTFARRF